MRSAALVCILVALSTTASAATDEHKRFAAFLDEDWEWQMREFPTWATLVGDSRYDDKLPDYSLAAIERRKAHRRDVIKQLGKIDRARLTREEQLDYDLYLRDARLDVEGERFPEELLAIDKMGGVHTMLADLAPAIPRRNALDFEHFLARIDAYPKLVDENLALLRKGLERGVTPPRVTLEHLGESIGNQISDDPTKSPVYVLAFAQLPSSVSAADAARLQAAARKAIVEHVNVPLRAFKKFIVDEYVPHARTTLGMSALPDGAAWYAYRARVSTTTEMSPEKIHELGLAEVARIGAAAEQTMRASGWKGSMPDFVRFLRSDPRFYFTDKDALLTAYRDIAKRIDPELPRLFGRL
ncbi:MAG TPA: DUF885 family protein, partial [Polyangia bacterium]